MMMGLIDEAVDIEELGQSNLWVIYGKSNSGKTKVASTFPKPLLYIQLGDDGSNTIAQVDGIKALVVESIDDLKKIAKEVIKDKTYKTVVVDTFSMIVSEWVDQKIIAKKKRMTQQAWGDLKADTEEIIRLFQKAAKRHIVVLTCHESTDSIEGMEDEITPDVRPSVSKGARTYLEGMANYGIHLAKVTKEKTLKNGTTKEVVRFVADVGPNVYYWTKFQIDPSIKLPDRVINPSYNKIMGLINNTETEE